AGLSMDAVTTAYERWREIQNKLEELERDEQDRLRMVDLWSFQHREIESTKPEPGEDEALETERRVLVNAEKLYAASMSAYDLLYDGSASAESTMRAALKQVEELARYDAKFSEAQQQLAS